jgi:hypothetical protein
VAGLFWFFGFLGLVGFFASSFPAKKDATCTNSTTEITAGESIASSVCAPSRQNQKIMATTFVPATHVKAAAINTNTKPTPHPNHGDESPSDASEAPTSITISPFMCNESRCIILSWLS